MNLYFVFTGLTQQWEVPEVKKFGHFEF